MLRGKEEINFFLENLIHLIWYIRFVLRTNWINYNFDKLHIVTCLLGFFRAHFLDAKSLSVYGVYMPRTNPQGIFMTGHAKRSRDKGQNIPAVPPGTFLETT